MGKSTIVFVLGLSLIVSLALISMNSSSTDSMDTYSAYYYRTAAHNIATSGANVATQLCMFNTKPASNLLTGNYFGGSYSVTIDSTKDSTVIVSCATITNNSDITRDTVRAVLKYTRFSKYGYFSQSELNGYVDSNGTRGSTYGGTVQFISRDSLFGPVHTNSKFSLYDSPYFNDKVTATNAPTLLGTKKPIYYAGYQWGITVNRPDANMAKIKSVMNNSTPASIKTLMSGRDISLWFNADGTVRLRIPPTGSALKDTTMPIASYATSGVIGVENGSAYVSGTYHGQVTVAAFKGTSGAGLNRGNVWIVDDLVAANNPVGNLNSPDMLGIVAERNAYIKPGLGDLTIQATIYCHTGEFTLYDFQHGGPQGRLNLYGGVIQNTRGAVGTYSGSTVTNGYLKSYRFDQRFATQSPPHFPASDKLELASWWEN